MKRRLLLLTIVLFVTATPVASAPDYTQPTHENIVHAMGTFYYSYGFNLGAFTTFYNNPDLHKACEECLTAAAKQLKIKLNPDPKTVKDKAAARKAAVKYLDAGDAKVNQYDEPYLVSCFGLGLTSGIMVDIYFYFDEHKATAELIKKKKQDGLLYLDNLETDSRGVNATQALLDKIEEMRKATAVASSADDFTKLALKITKWKGEMFEFLKSTSYTPSADTATAKEDGKK